MLIGLCGRAGSGKSTVATYLVERYGFVRLSFARPLKEIAKEIWGFSDEQVYGTQKQKETMDPRWGVSPRVALQRLGTTARNHLGADVWIRGCLGVVRDPNLNYVIEDLRYLNEAVAIREAGGKVVRLVCPDRISMADESHPSEAEVDLIWPDLDIVSHKSPGASDLLEMFERSKGLLEVGSGLTVSSFVAK